MDITTENTCLDPHKKDLLWDFPGGPVVKTPRFNFRGRGFYP